MKQIVPALILGGLVFASAPRAEATVFDFTSGSISGSGYGNSLTLTVDGITVEVTGWGIGGGAGGTFSSAQIAQWSTGLGNCNQGEGTNCPTGPHAADNVAQTDVFFMTFSTPVIPESALITAWASDYDISYWGGAGPFSIAGKTVGDLGTTYNSDVGGTATSGSSMRNADLTELNAAVDWLAIGARIGHENDRFKLKSAVFSVPELPEPGVVTLLVGGVLALAASRRRRA